MIIYCDKETGDEMFSDAYPMKAVKDILYEVEAKMITISQGADIDIGANPSAEGGEDDGLGDNQTETVNNIVHAFRLVETSFEKKDYMTYFKGYLQKYKKDLNEEQQKAVAAYFKDEILGKFKDWEFFTGESMNPDGLIALMNYREDGITPYFVFWKFGLNETKV